MDLPRKETPRFWMAFGILCAAFVLAMVVSVVMTVDAKAQELMCVPGDALIRQTIEVRKMRPVWEGSIPPQPGIHPGGEVVAVQSDKGAWVIFLLSEGNTCLLLEGTDANPPINLGKGV